MNPDMDIFLSNYKEKKIRRLNGLNFYVENCYVYKIYDPSITINAGYLEKIQVVVWNESILYYITKNISKQYCLDNKRTSSSFVSLVNAI